MFTRQHYKEIAKVIKSVYNYEGHDIQEENNLTLEGKLTAKEIAVKLADYFAGNNSRFDRQKFLTACGL